MLPEDMYMYSFIPDKKINQCDLRDPELEWVPLDDAPESTKKLVCWMYNFHVKGGDDRTVCCWEEPVFSFRIQSSKQGRGVPKYKCLMFACRWKEFFLSAWQSNLCYRCAGENESF